MRDIWESGIGWDDVIKGDPVLKWHEWITELKLLTEVCIPRCYSLNYSAANKTELHVFCDASSKAYAAAAYMRTFVANRIDEICEKSKRSEWNWVPTDDNIADIITRDVNQKQKLERWIKGPKFLESSEQAWPAQANKAQMDVVMVVQEQEDALEIIARPNIANKRKVLAAVNSVYDPLGLLTPTTIKGRKLMRDIWESGIGWDDVIKGDPVLKWHEWITELKLLTEVCIPRCYSLNYSAANKTELHVFCDASSKAYAAAAYMRTFVANRIDEICEKSKRSEWNWVPTDDNIADIITRDVNQKQKLERWIKGPKFLESSEQAWPAQANKAQMDVVMVVQEQEDALEIIAYFVKQIIWSIVDDGIGLCPNDIIML
ncbi:hypothetical protein ACLKA6_000713 [Drosophila palustris]